jgi:hypothetical protein
MRGRDRSLLTERTVATFEVATLLTLGWWAWRLPRQPDPVAAESGVRLPDTARFERGVKRPGSKLAEKGRQATRPETGRKRPVGR